MPRERGAPLRDGASHLVELRITTAAETAKGVGGVKYGKWTSDLSFGESRKSISGTDHHQTIDTRGALLAAVAGLGALKRRSAVQIHSDSTYLLDGTVWLPLNLSLGWNTGPRNARIRNHDLWGQLRDLASRHNIQWIGPRVAKGEFGSVMPNVPTEIWRRTVGAGPDTGYLYAGAALPWDEVLGEYRAFTDTEIHDSAVCSSVDSTDDSTAAPLTPKEKQARKNIISRIAKHYQPEYIRPAPRREPSPPVTPAILEPTKVNQLVAAFNELRPAVDPSFLRYPRADARFRYPTARSALLEIGIEQ